MPAHLDWNWELEIKFKPQELEEAYELYFFLGSVPSSPSNWRDSPSRLFEPITSREETEHTEYRYLNGYLEDRCEGKLEDDDVVPYLRKHLSWRIKKLYHDKKIDNSKLKSLKLTLSTPNGDITLSDEKQPCE